jgi:hypothetical protein
MALICPVITMVPSIHTSHRYVWTDGRIAIRPRPRRMRTCRGRWTGTQVMPGSSRPSSFGKLMILPEEEGGLPRGLPKSEMAGCARASPPSSPHVQVWEI